MLRLAVKRVMKEKGLGLFNDQEYILLFVGSTENALAIPGIPKSDKSKLCETIEPGHLEFKTLNIAVFSGKEVDGFQKTKSGSNSVVELSALVDSQIRSITSNIIVNVRQKKKPDHGNKFDFLENYTIRCTDSQMEKVVRSLFDVAARKIVHEKCPTDVTSVLESLKWHLQNLTDSEIPNGVKFKRISNLGTIHSTPTLGDSRNVRNSPIELTEEEEAFIHDGRRKSSSSGSSSTGSSGSVSRVSSNCGRIENVVDDSSEDKNQSSEDNDEEYDDHVY